MKEPLRVLLVAVLALTGPRALGADDRPSLATVRTIDGRSFDGVMHNWTLGDSLALVSPAQATATSLIPSIEIDRVALRFEQSPAPQPAWAARTTDGELLFVEIESGDRDRIEFRSPALGRLAIPLERLLSIERPAQRVQVIQNRNQQADRVVLANGDIVAGLVSAVSRKNIRIEAAGAEQTVDWSVIGAVHFGNPSRPLPDRLTAWLRFRDGTRLQASALSWREASIEAIVLDDTRVHVSPAQLDSIEITGGRRDWLSELDPVAYESRPLLGPTFDLGRDRNALGGALRAGGRIYPRGLGMHSACRARWRLDRRYERLRALVALDDSAGLLAEASVRILVDNRVVAELDHLIFRQPPQPINIDLRGAAGLTIEVGYGRNADVQDRVDLLDAALIRVPGASRASPPARGDKHTSEPQ